MMNHWHSPDLNKREKPNKINDYVTQEYQVTHANCYRFLMRPHQESVAE
jgi:hypothetical protein